MNTEQENAYARAAAIWVGRQISVPGWRIRGVNFGLDEGYEYSSWTIEGPSTTLTFEVLDALTETWSLSEISFPTNVTPGQFIEECVAIMAEIEEALQ